MDVKEDFTFLKGEEQEEKTRRNLKTIKENQHFFCFCLFILRIFFSAFFFPLIVHIVGRNTVRRERVIELTMSKEECTIGTIHRGCFIIFIIFL